MAEKTAISAAFGRAGINRLDMIAKVQAKEFIRQGGDLERWVAAFKRAAEEIPGEGHVDCANSHLKLADPRSPLRSEGQRVAAPISDQVHAGVPQPIIGGAAKPTAARLAAEAKIMRLTILDTRKTSDGRPWGDVGIQELDGMDRDGAISRGIKRKLGVITNAQRFMSVRELIRPNEFEDIIREANDA